MKATFLILISFQTMNLVLLSYFIKEAFTEETNSFFSLRFPCILEIKLNSSRNYVNRRGCKIFLIQQKLLIIVFQIVTKK